MTNPFLLPEAKSAGISIVSMANNPAGFLDMRIRERFRIFKGFRTENEDLELYRRIYVEIYRECLKFLEENLNEQQQDNIRWDITKTEKEDESPQDRFIKVYTLILKHLVKIEDVNYRLDRRLDHFINNLLLSSLST